MDYAGQFKQSQEGRARFNLCYAHEPRARCVVKFCLQVLYTVTLFVCAVIVHLLLSLAGGSRAVEGSEERYHFVVRDGFFFDKDGVKTVQSFMMDNPDVGKLDKHGQPEPARIATGTMLCSIALEPILTFTISTSLYVLRRFEEHSPWPDSGRFYWPGIGNTLRR